MNYEKGLKEPLKVSIIESISFYKGKEFKSEYSKDSILEYSVEKVIGLDCPNKFLITINKQIVCFVNSRNSVRKVLTYAYTKESKELEDEKIKKRIDLILNRNNKEYLQNKLKDNIDKAINISNKNTIRNKDGYVLITKDDE